jgi:hypothetical protein
MHWALSKKYIGHCGKIHWALLGNTLGTVGNTLGTVGNTLGTVGQQTMEERGQHYKVCPAEMGHLVENGPFSD